MSTSQINPRTKKQQVCFENNHRRDLFYVTVEVPMDATEEDAAVAAYAILKKHNWSTNPPGDAYWVEEDPTPLEPTCRSVMDVDDEWEPELAGHDIDWEEGGAS